MSYVVGPVQPAHHLLLPCIVRSEGLHMRPSDGALVDADAADALPLPMAKDEESHLVSFPEGTKSVEIQDGDDRRFVIRLPGGTLVSVEATLTRLAAQQIDDENETVTSTTTKAGLFALTELSTLTKLLDRLDDPMEHVVLGPMAVLALVSPDPMRLGVTTYAHRATFVVGNVQFDFVLFQAFVLPEGTIGVRSAGRTIALIDGEPLVITELSLEHARWTMQYMFKSVEESAPEEVRSLWAVSAPDILADYGHILDRIAPISNVSSAASLKEAIATLRATTD